MYAVVRILDDRLILYSCQLRAYLTDVPFFNQNNI